jgi:hypothetical protein
MAVVDQTDANYLAILPAMVTYAENRMYRDLDFLFTSTSITGYAITNGSRQITIPEGTIVVSEQINVITPAGQINPDAGTRNPLLPTTKEYLDAVYGSASYTGIPRYFVPFNDNLFLVGPFSDATYYVEIVGTYRPASLSSTNTTTWVSLNAPEALLYACLIQAYSYTKGPPDMLKYFTESYQQAIQGLGIEQQGRRRRDEYRDGMIRIPIKSESPGP